MKRKLADLRPPSILWIESTIVQYSAQALYPSGCIQRNACLSAESREGILSGSTINVQYPLVETRLAVETRAFYVWVTSSLLSKARQSEFLDLVGGMYPLNSLPSFNRHPCALVKIIFWSCEKFKHTATLLDPDHCSSRHLLCVLSNIESDRNKEAFRNSRWHPKAWRRTYASTGVHKD